jgi:hypothetical protein
MKRLFLLLTLAACLLLPACTIGVPRQAMSCGEIVEAPLRSLNFDELSRERMPQWIQENYQVEDSDIARYDSADDPAALSFGWDGQRKSYEADFVGQGLEHLWVWWEGQKPTGSNFVECFGTPDFYRAWVMAHERIRINLEIWYLEEGLVVSTEKDYNPERGPPSVNDQMVMTRLTVLKPHPDSIKEMVHSYITSDELLTIVEESLQPWPGRWDAINVEPDPALRP